MRLYEWEAKALLADGGIAIPDGTLETSAAEAEQAAVALGVSVAVKAQIPSGRRMKAGGILFADSPVQAREAASRLLGNEVLGFRVEHVLVEPRVAFDRELFLAITYDTVQKAPVILASAEGGIEVERAVRGANDKMVSQPVDLSWPFSPFMARDIALGLGLRGREVSEVGEVIRRLFELFRHWDATLVEINPLVPTADGLVALDAHIDLEDDALGRHPELSADFGIPRRRTQGRPPTPFEVAASQIDTSDHRGVAGRVVEFDGDLGLLIGGGGASLTVFDAILDSGGRPANYCEIGGNPSVQKICQLTKLILSKPAVRKLAVIMNVVNNTRVDLVARGVIKGIIELDLSPSEVISVFRLPGAWEAEGARILQHYEVPFCDRTVSLDEAARLAVTRSR